MIMKATYKAPVQEISIFDLLHQELQCRKLPTNGKMYPENQDKPYFISGVLSSVDVSPYHKIDVPNTTYGVPLGEFSVSGIISDLGTEAFRLAFRYAARDYMPVAASYKIEDFNEFIRAQREGDYAAYLHLRDLLRTDKPSIALEGKVLNSNPRLFLPSGIVVGVDTLRTRHGSIHGDQNKPIDR